MTLPAPVPNDAVAARPPLGHTAAAVILALLLGLQPLSTDAYLPALPMLQQQILKQQGINNVYAISGATMTSEAYGQSLQNALDQAHITR